MILLTYVDVFVLCVCIDGCDYTTQLVADQQKYLLTRFVQALEVL